MVKYYSKIDDENFEMNTCNKKEFKKYVYPNNYNSDYLENIIPNYLTLSPHQQFLVNYIHPKTPYKGILIYHETGTGKTCTAISIAENFKKDLKKKNKKIQVLCSDTVKKEFYDTLTNNKKLDFKCVGDTYTKENDFNINTKSIIDLTNKDYKKRVDKFYSFTTYVMFGKKFKKWLENEEIEVIDGDVESDESKKKIKKNYSDEFFIIDEAHNIRVKSQTAEQNEKWSHIGIDLISKYADNVKILFLTATPMFDNPREIIWLINVLIRVNNDNCDELDDSIFSKRKEYSLTKNGKQSLIRAMRGKVSFLRTGNPTSFPIKLFEKNITEYQIPKYEHGTKIRIDKNDKIYKQLKLTFSEISDEHYQLIKKYRKKTKDHFHMSAQQLHNVSWYSNQKATLGNTNAGLNKHFYIDNGTYTPKEPNILKNLEKYAPKIKNIINHIIEMDKGIVFIYSQFIPAGVIPIMLALEQFGFTKYTTNSSINHLKLPTQEKDKIKKRGKYIVITSDEKYKSDEKYVNLAKSHENMDGNIIKVIIISSTGSEGLDLKYIRQVHILEPHFNFSEIEQAVGRAVRNNSHKELEPEKRNCTVYYHTTTYPEKYANKKINQETVDMHMYKLAFNKKNGSNIIKKIIEENSITCKFFKNFNSFKWSDYIDKNIIDSKGNKLNINYDILHDSYSSTECKTCLCLTTNSETDNDTYNPIVHSKSHIYQTIELIFYLFKYNNEFTLEEIVNYINNITNNNIDTETIYFALDLIINSNKVTKNKFQIDGKIRKVKNYYKFIPNYALYTNLYNDIPLQLSNSYVSLESIDWENRPQTVINVKEEINEKYNKYIKFKNFVTKYNFWDDYVDIRNQLLADVIIDQLSSEKRFALFWDQKNISSEFKNAINRYSVNKNFRYIQSITEHYVIVNENKQIIKTISVKNNKKSKKSNLYAFYDFDGENGVMILIDSRNVKSPQGKRFISSQKKDIVELLNYLYKTNFINYDKYIAKNSSNILKGQIFYDDSDNQISGRELLIELDILFRFLEKQNNSETKWFYNSWEAYDYNLKKDLKV